MTKLERSIVIKGTPAEIEAITNNIDRVPDWYAGVTKARVEGVFPEPGSKVFMTYKAAGITFEASQTTLEYFEGQGGKYILEGMITGNYADIIEKVPDGTRLTFRFDYEMPGGSIGKVVDRLFVERMNAKNLEDSLKNLKVLVEEKVKASS